MTVGGASKTAAVPNIDDLVQATDLRAYSGAVSTGLEDLDRSTGGFLPGALWIVLGTPGVGRTILATQLAAHAAVRLHVETSLVLGRDPSGVAILNIHCQLARADAGRVQRGTETPDEAARLAQATRLLSNSPLSIWSAGDGLSVLEHREQFSRMYNAFGAGDGSGRLVVIDDLEDFDDYALTWGVPREPGLDRLRRLRRIAQTRQSTVVVTMPEEHWLDGPQVDPELRRHADVILRLMRPDMFVEDGPRADEADLHLVRNRTGRSETCTVTFQGHYRRFADMSSH